MNQQKIGEFLRELRKEKGLTQEEFAEKFYTSSRTVSRWETGKTMPDLTVLIELADFYDVDIRELIEGERESENMDKEIKRTLLKVGEYAQQRQKRIKTILTNITSLAVILMLLCYLLFKEGIPGCLYGIVPKNICNAIMWSIISIAYIALIVLFMYNWGIIEKIQKVRTSKKKNNS